MMAPSATVRQPLARPAAVPAPGPLAARTGPGILLDAHAHYWPHFGVERFLDAVAGNLAAATAALQRTAGADGQAAAPEPRGAVIIASTPSWNGWQAIRAALQQPQARWRAISTDEPSSILAAGPRGEFLALIAGWQMRTREGLEVLSLGAPRAAAGGLKLHQAVRAAGQDGAIAVVPWGFGKWLGRRARILQRLIESSTPGGFWLGDTRHRPRAARRHRLFALAESRGIGILTGSDPLPSHRRAEPAAAGSCGSILPGPLDAQRPWAGIAEVLQRSHPSDLGEYGTRLGLLESVWTQAALRLDRARPPLSPPAEPPA